MVIKATKNKKNYELFLIQKNLRYPKYHSQIQIYQSFSVETVPASAAHYQAKVGAVASDFIMQVYLKL